MNAIGIVSEYNPIHNGHAYHMNRSRELSGNKAIVLVMSGNFVQRGEAAILPKSTRTSMALAAGADLVIELPTVFAASSAESFASMAVRLLSATKVVDELSFGSESGDLDALKQIASYLVEEPAAYRDHLHEQLSKGLSFPKARAIAIQLEASLSPSALDLIESPNNILGIEYLKAIERYKLELKPMTVKRIGAGYHDTTHAEAYPSATAIRGYLKAGGDLSGFLGKIPQASFEIMQNAIADGTGPVYADDYFPYIKYRLLTADLEELALIMDIGEGMEHRLIRCAGECSTYEELIDCISTKRYTRTRISRALTHVLLNIRKEDFTLLNEMPSPYMRVLGFTNRGRRLLKEIKNREPEWPVIINVRDSYNRLDEQQRRCFDIDLRATALYNQILHDKFGVKMPNDFQMPVIRY